VSRVYMCHAVGGMLWSLIDCSAVQPAIVGTYSLGMYQPERFLTVA